ncbi:MAG: signal peptidase I [Erythrobacter sp.]
MDGKPAHTNSFGAAAHGRGESLGSFASFVFKLVLVVVLFRSFVFAPFSIPSESMLPRLWNGDVLLAAKWPYGISSYSLPFELPLIPGRLLPSEPERGDIVIFKHPVDGTDYIKRVIGLPGDKVAMVDGQVVLNDAPLVQQRLDDFVVPVSPNTRCAVPEARETDSSGKAMCRHARYRETLPSGKSYEILDLGGRPVDNTRPITVPEGRLFVMGDNRDNSQDSRFQAMAGAGVGLVPQNLLVGQARVIVWSTDGSAEWVKPWTWFSATRWQRIGDVL